MLLAPQGGDPRGRRHALQLDLSTCVTRYGPPPAALATARAVGPALLREHPYGAADRLRAAYAGYLDVPADQLVAGRGVSELIWQLAAGPLGPRVVVPLPAYTEFRQAFPAGADGGAAWAHSQEVVAAALARGAVVLLANPHNPSGRAFAADELAALAAEHPTGVLVVDESYVEFCAEPGPVSLVGVGLANVVVLRSPSKFFGLAGCRVGVAWSRSAALRAGVDGQRGSWPVSALEVAPVEAALEDEVWAKEARAAMVDDGRWLGGAVAALGEVVPGSVTPFRLVARPDAAEVAEALAVRGVGVRLLGEAHGLPGPALRVAAPRAPERPLLEAALAAVAPAG